MAPKESTRVVCCLFAVLFLGVADNQVVSPLLPAIRAAFARSPHEVGALFTAYALAAGVSGLFWGPLSDRIGPRHGLLLGLVGFAAGSTASFGAPTFGLLVAARAVTGMAASLLSLNTITFAADFFPYRTRGRAMGMIFSSYFAALILGVPLGAVGAQRLGWQSVFCLAAGTAVVLLALVRRWLPAAAVAARRPTVSLGAAFHSYAGSLATAPRAGALLGAMAASAGMMGFLTFVGIWLHDSFGASTRDVGLVFLASGAAALAVSPIAGVLSDRVGKKTQFVLASTLLAVLLVALPRLTWGAGLLALFCALGVAAALRQGPMEALVTEVAPPGLRGSFVALKNTASQIGIALAAWTSGYLLEHGGYARVCLVAAGLNLLAAALVLALVRRADL